jgi:hypothetical protein
MPSADLSCADGGWPSGSVVPCGPALNGVAPVRLPMPSARPSGPATFSGTKDGAPVSGIGGGTEGTGAGVDSVTPGRAGAVVLNPACGFWARAGTIAPAAKIPPAATTMAKSGRMDVCFMVTKRAATRAGCATRG